MAQLTIVYDELEPPLQFQIDKFPKKVVQAVLPLPNDLKREDIYGLAQSLALLLLESLTKEP